MEADFWQERWEKGEIGFHKKHAHRDLIENYPRLELAAQDKVLVPLCGKSLDLLWLEQQGLQVVGVELSRLAVAAFFSENDLTPRVEVQSPYESWRAGEVELLVGDLFALQPPDDGFAAIYDRAALVALPPAMRPGYAAKLAGLLSAGGKLLLVSYDYPQAEMSGPPFSVPLAEVEALFGGDFVIEVLSDEDTLQQHRGLQQQGVTALREFCCLLTRK